MNDENNKADVEQGHEIPKFLKRPNQEERKGEVETDREGTAEE